MVAASALPAEPPVDATLSTIQNDTLVGYFLDDPVINCEPTEGQITPSDFSCHDAFDNFIQSLDSNIRTVFTIAKIPQAMSHNLIVPKKSQEGTCRFKITTSLPIYIPLPAIRASVFEMNNLGNLLLATCVHDSAPSRGGKLRYEWVDTRSGLPHNFLEMSFYVSYKPLTDSVSEGSGSVANATVGAITKESSYSIAAAR